MKKLSILVLFAMMLAVLFTACGEAHDHTYSDKWTTDSENHWHKATCEHTDAIASKGAHTDTDEDGACDVCGLGDAHNHNYSDEWCNDAENHWHAATCDGHADEKIVVTPHADSDENGICDVCAYNIFYTVSVDYDADLITLAGDLTTKASSTVSFSATVGGKYLVSANGAQQSGDAVTNADGTVTYSYTVENVSSQDVVVELAAERFNYAEVVATGTASFETLSSFSFAETEFEVEIPAAGYYVIVSDVIDVDFFGTEEGAIVADEAGTYTVTARYFSWEDSDEGLEFNYTVLEASLDITLDESGEGYILPANIYLNISFVAPAAGNYFITSSVLGLAWNDDISINGIYVQASEAGEVFEFSLLYNDETENVFEFDWTTITPEAVVLNKGANTFDVTYGQYTLVSFTADAEGNYAFGFETSYVFAFYESIYCTYTSSATYYLEAGETVSFYVYYPYAEEDYTENAQVYPALSIYEDNLVSADNDGEIYAFLNDLSDSWSSNNFTFTAAEGTLIALVGEGELEWVDTLDVIDVAGESMVLIAVKTTEENATEASVYVSEKTYELYLELGENEVTLTPGVIYNLYLIVDDTYVDVTLDWDNDSVFVYLQNEDSYTAGSTAMWYYDEYNWTIINDSFDDVTLTMTLGYPSAGGEDVEYDGSFTVTCATFGTSAYAGKYDYVIDEFGAVTVYSNGSLTQNVMISVGMGGVYTVQFADMRMPVEIGTALSGTVDVLFNGTMHMYTITFGAAGGNGGSETPASGLVVGENHVTVTVSNYYCPGVEISFTATEAGTYTLSAAAGEENAEVYSMINDEFVDLPYSFTVDAGQTVTFVIFTTAIMTLTEDVIDLVITKL